MGGICGVVYAERDRAVENNCLKPMTLALGHRSPDPGSYYVYGHVGLGIQHPSLPEVDHSQPIHNTDQSIWGVVVGELLNNRELATQLTQLGHQFYTTTDTELFVHAYEEFEDEFLEHLDGTFAFAIWDARNERLVLGRDRVGTQPLYFARHDQGLLFGSELHAILAYPGFPRRINPAALSEYLSFTYVPTPHSIAQGVSKLPPGHALSYARGQLDIWQYWDVDFRTSEQRPSRATGDDETELLAGMRTAVRQAMMREPAIGVALDGSLGSIAIAALMAEVTPNQVRSFALRLEQSGDVRAIAEHLHTEHHELTLTPPIFQKFVPKLGQLLDEPLGDWSLLPQFFLAQFTRCHVPTVLSAAGGETLWGGSRALQAHRMVEYYERLLPSVARRYLLPWFLDRVPGSSQVRRFLDGRGLPAAIRHQQWLGAFTVAQKSQLLEFGQPLQGQETYQVVLKHQTRSQAREALNQLLYCDLKLELEGKILTTHRRAHLHNALAVQFPFLNTALVENAAQVPHHLKLLGLTPQYLLRQTLRPYVPDALLRSRSTRLKLPMAQWLTGSLRPLVEDLLSPSRLRRAGFFDVTVVRQLWQAHQRGQQDHSQLLWTLLAFELWYEQWSK